MSNGLSPLEDANDMTQPEWFFNRILMGFAIGIGLFAARTLFTLLGGRVSCQTLDKQDEGRV